MTLLFFLNSGTYLNLGVQRRMMQPVEVITRGALTIMEGDGYLVTWRELPGDYSRGDQFYGPLSPCLTFTGIRNGQSQWVRLESRLFCDSPQLHLVC